MLGSFSKDLFKLNQRLIDVENKLTALATKFEVSMRKTEESSQQKESARGKSKRGRKKLNF